MFRAEFTLVFKGQRFICYKYQFTCNVGRQIFNYKNIAFVVSQTYRVLINAIIFLIGKETIK